MSSIQQLIEKEINEVALGIKTLAARKIQLEQALALVIGKSPAAAPSQVATPKQDALGKKQKQKKKGDSPATIARRSWKANSPMPWKPAPHAKASTQAIYDLLEDGTPYTAAEITTHVQALYPDANLKYISGTLTHMKNTGRLMHEGTKWRRKYARQHKAEITISADNAPAESKSEAVAKLDSLVEEGKLIKVERSGGSIYTPIASVASKGSV